MRRRKTYLSEALQRRVQAVKAEKSAYLELEVAQEIHRGTLSELQAANDQLMLARQRHATLNTINGNGHKRRRRRGLGTPRRQVRRRKAAQPIGPAKVPS